MADFKGGNCSGGSWPGAGGGASGKWPVSRITASPVALIDFHDDQLAPLW